MEKVLNVTDEMESKWVVTFARHGVIADDLGLVVKATPGSEESVLVFPDEAKAKVFCEKVKHVVSEARRKHLKASRIGEVFKHGHFVKGHKRVTPGYFYEGLYREPHFFRNEVDAKKASEEYVNPEKARKNAIFLRKIESIKRDAEGLGYKVTVKVEQL